MTHSRGSVLTETALIVSAVLVFMLGTVELGVIGGLQIISDSAAYYDAHLNVMGVTTAPTQPAYWMNQQFPQIPVADVSATVMPAASPTIPVDYGWNDPNPVVAAQSAYNRKGGASMLQPALEQATVNVPGVLNILGQGLGVNAVSVETQWLECGIHFDVANEGCSVPPAAGQQNTQESYFTEGENTPPYMVGFNFLEQCENMGQPFGQYTGGNPYAPVTNTLGLVTQHITAALNDSNTSANPTSYALWNGPCVANPPTTQNYDNTGLSYIALGTAEYLDAQNWGNQGNGVGVGAGISGPCNTTPAGSSVEIDTPAQNVFCAIWWHQSVYADLANYFEANPQQYYPELFSQMYDWKGLTYLVPTFNWNGINQFGCSHGTNPTCGSATTKNAFGPLDTNQLSFALGNGAGTGAWAIPENLLTKTGYVSFLNWEGFDDNNYGPNYTSGLDGDLTPDRWNNDVHIIYSWDLEVNAGPSLSNPTFTNNTHPLSGCCSL